MVPSASMGPWCYLLKTNIFLFIQYLWKSFLGVTKCIYWALVRPGGIFIYLHCLLSKCIYGALMLPNEDKCFSFYLLSSKIISRCDQVHLLGLGETWWNYLSIFIAYYLSASMGPWCCRMKTNFFFHLIPSKINFRCDLVHRLGLDET